MPVLPPVFFRMLAVLAAYALIVVAMPSNGALAQDKFPALWHKTMTNDPATNIYLAQYSKSLGNPAADTLRNVMLSLALNHYCEGMSVNQKAAADYLKTSGYYAIKGKPWDDASFLANDQFKYFDYRAMAHLCAGGTYLFGKAGVLIKDVLTAGTGEPKTSYDPANPYVAVPALQKPGS